MKIFVFGLPHIHTSTEYTTCAFTMKAWNLCKIMTQRGHTVIHLGTEGSNPSCTEHVSVVSKEMFDKTYGKRDSKSFYDIREDGPMAPLMEEFQKKSYEAIMQKASEPYSSIVCVTWGGPQIRACNTVPQFVVESGIGYPHLQGAKYRVFESHAWEHYHRGKDVQAGKFNGKIDGDMWYDCVIPMCVDPNMFRFQKDKEDWFLFMGRLIDSKGVSIAVEVCKNIGAKLKIVGQGDPTPYVQNNPHVEYLPPVGVEGRKELMAKAKGFFCPTRYVEPFGSVAVEAQFSGTPVICTDWGGFTDTVLHGHTGFRCRTFDQFVWAAKNIHKINPTDCHTWACNFTLQKQALMYEEYFQSLLDLNNKGWYELHPKRFQLDWLKKVYP